MLEIFLKVSPTYFTQLYVEIVQYGLYLLQLVEAMLGYARQFFDVGFYVATDPALALGFCEFVLVMLDEIGDGSQAGRHAAIPHMDQLDVCKLSTMEKDPSSPYHGVDLFHRGKIGDRVFVQQLAQLLRF